MAMNNGTEVSIHFDNKISNQNKLEKYAQTLEHIRNVTAGLDSKTIGNIEQGANNIKRTSGEADKMAKNVNLAFDYGVIKKFIGGLKTTFTQIGKLTDKSADYLENINLFRVAFNGAYQEAEKFVNQMSEMYGLDESQLTNTVGIFKQLTNAMNLSVETGTKLSKLLTQMTVDISSLYNIDVDKASSVLQSALAGQTKPIRGSTGGDITESTLQTTADEIGLDKYVGDLGYAEKRLLIVISLTKQLERSTGDFANTIEQPANQMRIMNEQWSRLTRTVGDIFLPVLWKVLPALNGILMVLTEIASVIASFIANLFGFKGADEVEVLAEDTYDLASGFDSASESAKKLKQGLRGFDKLNVITTPSSGDDDGGSGGIDPKLMDAFNSAFDEYQSKLESVTMKATIIRDKIMEWLGFTKLVDEATGDVSFKFEKITGGLATVVGVLSIGVLGAVTKIYGILSSIGLLPKIELFAGGLSAGTVGTVLGIAGAIAIMAYSLYDLYQKNEEFAKSFDEKWAGIQEAVQPIIERMFELFETLKTTYESTLKPMIEEIYSIIQTLSATLLEVLYPVFKDFLLPVFELAIQMINDFFQIFNELWQEYGKPISDLIKQAIEDIGRTFNKLWEQVLEPIVSKIMEIFTDLWENTLKPMFKKIGQVIGELVELILVLWDNVLQPLINWVIDVFGPVFDTIFSFVGDVFHVFFKIVGGVINGILDILKGIIKFVTGVFKGDWKKAWDGIVDILKGVLNIGISVVEGMINSVIALINLGIKGIWNGIKGLVNAVLSTVESIADFLGFDIDITLKGKAPQIPKVSIPRLKTGLDFVPNDFYPAYLDYGERVLTKEENRDYNAGIINGVQATEKSQPINATFIIQVGDEEVARKTLNKLQNIAKSNGKPIIIGG